MRCDKGEGNATKIFEAMDQARGSLDSRRGRGHGAHRGGGGSLLSDDHGRRRSVIPPAMRSSTTRPPRGRAKTALIRTERTATSTSPSTASSSAVAHMWRPPSRSPAPHRHRRAVSRATSWWSPRQPSARGAAVSSAPVRPKRQRHRSRLHRGGRRPLHRWWFADQGRWRPRDTWTHDPLRPTSRRTTSS